MDPLWRTRGYLPHFDRPGSIQAIVFRLVDSVPSSVLRAWKAELNWSASLPARDLRNAELRRRVDAYEDSGRGECWLRSDAIAKVVETALLFQHDRQYRLLAWCVMPNHVHVVAELGDDCGLERVIHSWKSYSAGAANRILGRRGPFWAREYFDRSIRNERHLRTAIDYVEYNPVAAGLTLDPAGWRWSSAGYRLANSRS